MNCIFRSIWRDALGTYVAVSENAGVKGRSSGVSVGACFAHPARHLVYGPHVDTVYACKAIAGSVLLAFTSLSLAGPTGAIVAAGNASVSGTPANLVVNQGSQNAVLNWQSFNIGAGESVRFVQPNANAVALNRVLGADPTSILGSLSANGTVFLINPNGILFGKGAQVNVGGLVASTLNIADSDFMARRYRFTGSESGSGAGAGTDAGKVSNQGTLTAADGGYIALLGANVSNQGTITARLGSAVLAAGSAMTLDVAGDGLLSIAVDRGALHALAENGGMIAADGGAVVMTAKAAGALLQGVVNNTGLIQAQSVGQQTGRIALLGDTQTGAANVAGKLDASAPAGGDGGVIETSAARVTVAHTATITTAAPNGKTGTWLIDPHDYTVAASGGDIDGLTLSTSLDSSNVTILSSSGANAAGIGNINVNDAVTWSADNRLTLTASNHININQNITANGVNAGISLNPNTANGSDIASGTGTINFAAGKSISLPNVTSGSTTAVSIGGVAYTVINSLGVQGSSSGTDLQGMNGGLAGNYVPGSDIDASGTSGWNSGDGFVPIGNNSTNFSGILEGFGHIITNLTINRPGSDYQGLLGYSTGTLRDIKLSGGSVSGNTNVGALVGESHGPVINGDSSATVTGATSAIGGLIGNNFGAVTSSHASGAVTGGAYSTGGLIGYNGSGVTVSNSSADTGAVIGSHSTGGLIGWNDGTVVNGNASGAVSSSTDNDLGGLIGGNYGLVTNGHASGTVTGSGSIQSVGGLVGYNDNAGIINYGSSDTGAVSGPSSVGGLVGWNRGAINNSFATKNVSSSGDNLGGLVGNNFGTISSSTASGGVTGNGIKTGGLVGYNQLGSTITDGSSNSVVSGQGFTGGLIGSNNGTVLRGIATGTVSGTFLVGGLSGDNYNATITDSHAGGAVTGAGDNVGGLAGDSAGAITNSYATGSVTDTSYNNVGGLVGHNTGTISGSYATGIVSAQQNAVGGLVGDNNGGGTISSSTSSGRVTSTGAQTGGLVGWNEYGATITDGSSSSIVSGQDRTGGLIGSNNGTVLRGIATGTVNGTINVGGLSGDNYNATITDSHAGGAVTGSSDNTGGLVGNSSIATVSNSTSSGGVTGTGLRTGGLVGWNQTGAIITDGSSSSVVSGQDRTGGLIGSNNGTVLRGIATGTVNGTINVGGLSGDNYNATVTDSHASGAVTGAGDTVGGLVGYNYSAIVNSYATGSVSATSNSNVGGLVGYNTGSITGSYATGIVSAQQNLGGLVGYNDGGTITGGTASGNVSGTAGFVGGLVGINYGTISSSSASGTVTAGDTYAGGLVGTNNGAISNSFATGPVSGTSYVGGLSGDNSSGQTISNSYATGAVTGSGSYIGGLVGYADSGAITTSYATNTVSGNSFTGGLVGAIANSSTIDRAYAAGAVTGTGGDNIGGLVGGFYATGYGTGTVTNSYATGNVAGGSGSYVGGLAGGVNGGTVATSYAAGAVSGTGGYIGGLVGGNGGTTSYISTYWNITTSGQATSAGGTGLTTAQMQQQTNFGDFDFSGTWLIYGGYTYPLLRNFMTPLTVTANDASHVYDRVGYSGGNGLSYSIVPNLANLFNTTAFTGTAQGATTVGSYTLAPDLYSNQLGYLISTAPGTLTITPKTLTVSASGIDKVYDRTTAASVTLGDNRIGGDTLSYTQTAAFVDSNAGVGKTVNVSGITLGGADAGNYVLGNTSASSTAAITSRALTVNGTVAANKTYDGTSAASISAGTLVNVVAGDSITLTQAGTFVSRNAGTGVAVTVADSIGGAGVGNYTLTQPVGVAADIAQRALTVSATGVNKTYDGTVLASVILADNRVVGDTLTLSHGGASFADAAVGTSKPITVSGIGVAGVDAPNYVANTTAMTTADIVAAVTPPPAPTLTPTPAPIPAPIPAPTPTPAPIPTPTPMPTPVSTTPATPVLVADPAPIVRPTQFALDDSRPVSGSLQADLQPSLMGDVQAGITTDASRRDRGELQAAGLYDDVTQLHGPGQVYTGLNLRVIEGGVRMPVSLASGRAGDGATQTP